MSLTESLTDSHGRVMRDLRISLTDRCNFRCLYCLPETEAAANFYRAKFDPIRNPGASTPVPLPPLKARGELLTFEEIERLARLAVGVGITKLRLTGGEPLLRNSIEVLVERLAAIEGVEDLAITTNGFFFARKAEALRKAGLHRVTFSLDSLDTENFKRITGRDGLAEVQAAIEMARGMFRQVKVNAVVIRGLNDHEVPALAAFAQEHDLPLRFIEFMPLDSSRAWLKEMVVPGREILQTLHEHFELAPVQSDNKSETARRWKFASGRGEIGVIAPVSEPFCGHCNRLRLTADGKIRTCLFSATDHDLRGMLRGGEGDAGMVARLREIVWGKEAGHEIGRKEFVQPARTMSCIGG